MIWVAAVVAPLALLFGLWLLRREWRTWVAMTGLPDPLAHDRLQEAWRRKLR